MSASHQLFDSLHNLQSQDTSTDKSALPPCIVCNEQHQDKTLEVLSKKQPIQHSVHIGFSVWFNLDIIATTRPDYGIILDFNPNTLTIYKKLQESLLESNNRETFINTFIKSIGDDYHLLYFPSDYTQAALMQHFNNQQGFLSSEQSFNFVKELIGNNKVFFGMGDLTNETQVNGIRAWCKSNHLNITTLYISNIAEWVTIDPKKESQLIQNIKTLSDANTCIVDAFYPSSKKDGSGPPQRITIGNVPDFKIHVEKKKQSQGHKRTLNFFDDKIEEGKTDAIGNDSSKLRK